jgi:hypothetical protein
MRLFDHETFDDGLKFLGDNDMHPFKDTEEVQIEHIKELEDEFI